MEQYVNCGDYVFFEKKPLRCG